MPTMSRFRIAIVFSRACSFSVACCSCSTSSSIGIRRCRGEGFPAFHALTGFIAFTLIVLGAKQLRRLIWRPENYYGRRSVNSEDYRPLRGDEEGEGRYARRGEDPDKGWANHRDEEDARS